jgi:hypothetical protein
VFGQHGKSYKGLHVPRCSLFKQLLQQISYYKSLSHLILISQPSSIFTSSRGSPGHSLATTTTSQLSFAPSAPTDQSNVLFHRALLEFSAMANAIGFALDAFSIVAAMASLFSHESDKNVFTNVKIGIGKAGQMPDGRKVGSANQGGSVPHIALFSEDQGRVGQYRGDENGHVGEGAQDNYRVYHTQTRPSNPDADATYLALSMVESDAICISYISMTTPSGINFAFFGDTAFKCGADWYYSALEVDNLRYTPRW